MTIFTEREQRILALIRESKTNREIAATFHVDTARIDQMVRRMKRKAGVRTKQELRALTVS
jgi:DNA-binding CsgD family transcriptional regulator